MEEPAEQNDIPDEEQASTLTNEKIVKTQNIEKSNVTRSNPADKSPGKTPDQRGDPEYDMEQETTSDIIPNNEENNMDILLNTKRPHQTD